MSTPTAILQRWILAAVVLIVTTTVWYLAHNQKMRPSAYRLLVLAIILADIVVASFIIYLERGMASRSVALYALPIAASAVLLNFTALMATAALCSAAYVLTAVSYFVLNFNEGFKAELYTFVGFYSALFFVLAALLGVVVQPKTKS